MYIYTNIPRDITKCKKAGYEQIDKNNFVASDKKLISFRAEGRKPRKPMSEEHKKKLVEGKRKSKN